MNRIDVYMLPEFLEGADLSESVAVVIDVLRASTTIVHALGHGAAAVIPCLEVDEARRIARENPESEILLGGERQGRIIDGFDLDNSPLSYRSETVAGRTIAFTTTNGTRALLRCSQAQAVFIGAFVNLAAVAEELLRRDRDVHLVCAGTDGQLTAEDILFAGALADELLTRSTASGRGEDGSNRAEDAFVLENVQAQMAVDFYRARSADPETFRRTMFESLGGRNLVELGFNTDIERTMQRDLFAVVPVWDPAQGVITALPR
jgi:2-phosphosulfolactate phosphatase